MGCEKRRFIVLLPISGVKNGAESVRKLGVENDFFWPTGRMTSSVTRRAFVVFGCAILYLGGIISPAIAQNQQQLPQSVSPQNTLSPAPIPGELELAKLIWGTIAAVDNANQSGNYSVLRDLSATGFQINNNPARLSEIFAGLRTSTIDLSNALLVAPTYTAPPQMVQPDVLYLRGYFGIRPTSVEFELYYQWMAGKWRLYGVSIVPLQVAGVSQSQNRPAPAPDKKRDR